jgi:hypothetical protein
MRGRVDFDGLERVSTQTLLDIVEVPQRDRTAGAHTGTLRPPSPNLNPSQ